MVLSAVGPHHLFIGAPTARVSTDAQNFAYELTTANLDRDPLASSQPLVPTARCRSSETPSSGPELNIRHPSLRCAFDKMAGKLDHAPAGCTECVMNDNCMAVSGRGFCNYGFCEAFP